MSGAVAAHAAYNGSGTQGLAVTNKIQGNDGDVMSVFWNKDDTTRQLLYGSTFVEIPSSSGSGNVSLTKANAQIFEVNNDIDCLGNLILKVNVDNVTVQTPITFNATQATTVVTAAVPNLFTAAMVGATISFTGVPSAGGIITSVPVGGLTAIVSTSATIGTATAITITFDTILMSNAGTAGQAASGNTILGAGTQFDASMIGSQFIFLGPGGVAGGGGIITSVSSATSLTVDAPIATPAVAALTSYAIVSKVFIEPCAAANIIDRIEFQVGTQIWQTLEKVDILALATTEIPESAYADFVLQSSGGYSCDSVNNGLNPITSSTGNTYYSTVSGLTAYIPLKLLTKTLFPRFEGFSEQTESGYLMAAAPNQQVKIKIFTSTRTSGNTTAFPLIVATGVAPNTVFAHAGFANANITLSLFGQQHIMCNEEREQVLAIPNGLPSRIKMTQNVQQSAILGAGSPTAINIVLDTFSLYASHLLISIPNNVLTPAIYGSDASTFELLLNSSSFSGALPFTLLNIIPSSLNLFNNNYITNGTSQNPYEVFVFPLASKAYGGSAVPLNRFDNITLRIKTAVGTPVGSTIFVTCVGETTALYKGGAASLAMY